MYRMLDDIRVLDVTHVLAGPFCIYQLAMLGARVTRVERPNGDDFARRPFFEPIFSSRAALEWEQTLQRANVPAAKVRTLAETLQHPELQGRGIVETAGRLPGSQTALRVPGVGFQCDLATSVNTRLPGLGEHTEEVLTELGLDPGAIRGLKAAEVVLGTGDGDLYDDRARAIDCLKLDEQDADKV